MFEKLGLVALDLKEVFAALFDNRASQRPLAVERVGGESLAFETGQRTDEGFCGALFATLGGFFLIHDRHGNRRTLLVVGQSNGADEVTDHFAIQTKGRRQRACASGQPAAQERGEGFRVHPTQDLVKNAVAGHFVEAAGALLDGQPESGTLFGLQASGKAGDFGHVARTGNQRHGHQRKHWADTKARVGAPRVGCLAQDFEQRTALHG